MFIKKSKELGLKLSEIKKIMRCSQRGLEPCCDLVRNLFSQKIKEYEKNIDELIKTRNRLKEKLRTWIKPAQAKKMKFSVCPQIETNERRK